jgi:enoyl-CoA hydratase
VLFAPWFAFNAYFYQNNYFMSAYTHIKTEVHGNTQLIILNRPSALNALNQEVLAELADVFQVIVKTETIRGVIVTGEGEKAFVAGADIKELSILSKAEALELSRKGHQLFSFIENSPKPVIALVNGFALGGGCELAMACHMRIATENAKFGLPEVNLGLIPGYGGTQRLTQLVGRPKALELAMTGDMVTAADAKTLGLVNHVVATKQEGLDLALKTLQKIEQKAPLAIAELIKSVNAGFGFETHGYKTEMESFAYLFGTHDFVEGTTAFTEKRKANFTGH